MMSSDRSTPSARFPSGATRQPFAWLETRHNLMTRLHRKFLLRLSQTIDVLMGRQRTLCTEMTTNRRTTYDCSPTELSTCSLQP